MKPARSTEDQLLELIRVVRDRNGRLILCGDTRQHGPVEASDALRAIERHSGLRAAELNQIRRQEPQRGRTAAQRKQIRDYREAVKAAAAGEVGRSFEKLAKLGAVVECGLGAQVTRLCDGYLDIAGRKDSVIVVSQTRAEVREINDAIRERLRERCLLAGNAPKVVG